VDRSGGMGRSRMSAAPSEFDRCRLGHAIERNRAREHKALGEEADIEREAVDLHALKDASFKAAYCA